jgi:C4-dicarboxylate transporter DctM subunit
MIQKLGYDPIWFGVIVVILLEMGAITPPVGINAYVIKGVA